MRALLTLVLVSLGACTYGPTPVAIDTANDACAQCRMIVSDVRLAAQVVAAGEEPLLFDDIGCLRDYLDQHGMPRDGTAFVADHRSGAWVPAGAAVYTRAVDRRTPMGSGILAHADRASRDADPGAAAGHDIAVDVILGARGK